MLHPNKGEGEHRSIIRKGPQLFTAALLIALPICMAQSATDAYANERTSLLPLQTQLQKGSKPQANSFLGRNLQTKWSSNLPNSTDIDTLQSTLSSYKSQLATLRAKTPKDPKVQATLDSAISSLEDDITALEETITQLKATYALLTKNNSTLGEAISSYNLAIAAKTKLAQELQDSDSIRQQALSAKLLKQDSLASATTAFDLAKTAKDDAQSAVDTAVTNVGTAITNLNVKKAARDTAQEAYDAALITLNTKSAALQAAINSNTTNTQRIATALAARDSALETLAAASRTLSTANTNLESAQATYTAARLASENASTTYSQLLDEYTTVYNAYLAAESEYQTAQATYNQAQSNLNQAQSNYDNNLIPDPNWVAPTQQVEHTRTITNTRQVEVRTQVPRTETTLQEQVIPNLLTNSSLTSTEGWSGVYAGWQGSQPGMYDGEITFSYTNQTVSQGLFSGPFQNATLTLSADWFSDWTADSYSMTVTAEDINRNPVGTATYTNTRTGHDWTNRSVTLEATGPVSYITVSFSGIDHGFWYGMYGPRMKNPALEVTHGAYVTQTVYDEVITYEEETYYTYETYYTTEVIQPQQGLTVRVYNNLPVSNPLRSDTAYNLCLTTTLTSINHNWSGGDILGCGSDRVMIHYTGYITPTENITSLRGLADDGFYLDVNGVNAINNWTLKGCGGNWNPVNLQAGQSYAIDAWFYEWGGGACSILNYQSANGEGVVPEAWYSNGASAPLIKDPALLPALQQAQAEYDAASEDYNLASSNWSEAQVAQQTAAQNSTDGYNEVIAKAAVETNAYNELQNTTNEHNSALQTKNNAEATSTQATSEYDSALIAGSTSTQEVEAAELARDEAITAKTLANSNLEVATTNLETATSELSDTETLLASKQTVLGNADALLTQATSAKEQATTELTDATTQSDSAETIYQETLTNFNAAEVALINATTFKETTEATVSTTETELTEKNQLATSASNRISFASAEELLNKEPDPVPEEEGSKEIPAELSAENLMEVNLEEVDPTELTEAQAEQLVEAALETFETAEEGSPEYEQALDALYLAAEQDDIELPEELAAIPGLAGAVEVLNFLGNAGADMSPKVREESEKVVVTAVVAAGAAIQSAAAAASTASAGAASSGGSRRVGK